MVNFDPESIYYEVKLHRDNNSLKWIELLAKDKNDKVIGYAGVERFFNNSCYLSYPKSKYAIEVDKNAREKGIGSYLMKLAIFYSNEYFKEFNIVGALPNRTKFYTDVLEESLSEGLVETYGYNEIKSHYVAILNQNPTNIMYPKSKLSNSTETIRIYPANS